jgi:hypothetical protein
MCQKELMSHCKWFSVGVYVDGPKELMSWFIILSNNSLKYYFQRICKRTGCYSSNGPRVLSKGSIKGFYPRVLSKGSIQGFYQRVQSKGQRVQSKGQRVLWLSKGTYREMSGLLRNESFDEK